MTGEEPRGLAELVPPLEKANAIPVATSGEKQQRCYHFASEFLPVSSG